MTKAGMHVCKLGHVTEASQDAGVFLFMTISQYHMHSAHTHMYMYMCTSRIQPLSQAVFNAVHVL